MGTTGSKPKTQGKVLNLQPEQQQQQQQQQPYYGILCDYHFIRIDIPFSIQMNLPFLRDPNMQMAVSDPNAYVPYLKQMYEQGFRLMSFQVTPGSLHTSGFLSMTSTTTIRAQAIFRKNEPKRPDERFLLEVVKSSIESGTFLTGTNFMTRSATHTETHTQHLYSVIHDFACRGCRLRCIEITGCHYARQQPMHGPQSMGIGSNMAYGHGYGYSASRIYGVDLFFEIPQHPSPELYQYQAVPLKLQATLNVSLGFMNQNQQWQLILDWQGVMNQYLGTGWRLIEVFNDMSAENAANMTGFGSSSQTTIQNVVFIFEKPQSRLNDNNPVYEGTMIEYHAPGSVSAGFGSSSMTIDTNWDGQIANMGQSGWELITVFQTPATTTKVQFMGASMSSLMWMFFQRQIVDKPVSTNFDALYPPVPAYAEKQ